MAEAQPSRQDGADGLETEGAQPEQSAILDSGKIPDDIPAADNDSVLEAQIRQAATEEKDPGVRASLWDEYRKYKGLPTKGTQK